MELTDALVRRLVDAQFPQWAHLPIRQVRPGGWDNRTFRLGEHLLVRLPSADGYAAAVAYVVALFLLLLVGAQLVYNRVRTRHA